MHFVKFGSNKSGPVVVVVESLDKVIGESGYLYSDSMDTLIDRLVGNLDAARIKSLQECFLSSKSLFPMMFLTSVSFSTIEVACHVHIYVPALPPREV